MSLQTQVFSQAAAGIPGSKAAAGVFDYYPQSLQAETGLSAGSFVWPGTDPARQAKPSGAGLPLGLVERSLTYPGYDLLGEGSLLISAGEILTIATQGAFYALSTTAAAVGQKVFAVLNSGAIKTGAAGAEIAGAVETSWRVITPGAAGEPIIIAASATGDTTIIINNITSGS
jgi:hypothetical protein